MRTVCRNQSASKSRNYCRIFRRHLLDLPEDAYRTLGIASGEHFFAHLDQGFDFRLALLRLTLNGKLRKDLVEGAAELAFGACRGQVRDELALEDCVDGGDRLNAELRGDDLVLVDVDLNVADSLPSARSGRTATRRSIAAPTRPAPW